MTIDCHYWWAGGSICASTDQCVLLYHIALLTHGVDNVPFSLLTEISAAMAWAMFGVDSAAPGELTRRQVVAEHTVVGRLARPFYWPHLHVCWMLSTGSCSTQRAHRCIYGCPGLKAFQPFLVSWWQRVSLHCWAGAGFSWSTGKVVSCCPNDLQAWLEARRGQPVCHWASS